MASRRPLAVALFIAALLLGLIPPPLVSSMLPSRAAELVATLLAAAPAPKARSSAPAAVALAPLAQAPPTHRPHHQHLSSDKSVLVAPIR
ncbi:MAG: hypothetical protein R2911_28795 [Caldilineaceae bacterium]